MGVRADILNHGPPLRDIGIWLEPSSLCREEIGNEPDPASGQTVVDGDLILQRRSDDFRSRYVPGDFIGDIGSGDSMASSKCALKDS